MSEEDVPDASAKRVADYFLVVGLPDDLATARQLETSCQPPLKEPITDITLIFPSQGEKVPDEYTLLEWTPSGHSADLNSSSLRGQPVFLCYKRGGKNKLPLTDIGVLYEGKDKLGANCEQIGHSYYGRPGYVNTKTAIGGQRTYITYRRMQPTDPMPPLAIVDLALILPKKGEEIPHSYQVVYKNINKGSVTGPELYLCYKKAVVQQPSLIFEPAIISRYPQYDLKPFSLSLIERDFPSMAMPNGASVQYWPPQMHSVTIPVFSTFVLTNQFALPMYGAAITFFEEFPRSRLTKAQLMAIGAPHDDQAQGGGTIQSDKCIVLLSRWPLFDAFKSFLMYLFRFCSSTGDRGPIPVERLISFFMHDVPCPSLEKPRIIVDMGDLRKIELTWPSACSTLPQKGSSFVTLLKNHGHEKALDLFTLVLLECSIVFHSLRPAVLTSVTESLLSAIFPLQFTGTYIPSCPRQMVTVAEAPGFNIIGIDSRTFDAIKPYDLLSSDGIHHLCFVDIDTNAIMYPTADDKKSQRAEKLLPKKAYKQLAKTLEKLFREIRTQPVFQPGYTGVAADDPFSADQTKIKIYHMENSVQDAFLRFMAHIMRGYQHFLRTQDNRSPSYNSPYENFTDLFDVQGFIRFKVAKDKSARPFYTTLCETQSFQYFIQLRCHSSGESVNNDYHVFFDECIDKSEVSEDCRLVEMDKNLQSEHSQFIPFPPAPDQADDPNVPTYNYEGIFPRLDHTLFPSDKLLTPIQHRDVSRLQGGSCSVPRRTPVESKASIRAAKSLFTEAAVSRGATVSKAWPEYLLMTCYSLWFQLLPQYVNTQLDVKAALKVCEDTLRRMLAKFVRKGSNMAGATSNADASETSVLPDETCYRVLTFIYAQHRKPCAIRQLRNTLREWGIKVNARTYTFMNDMYAETSRAGEVPDSPIADPVGGGISQSVSAKYRWYLLKCVVLVVGIMRSDVARQRCRSSLRNEQCHLASPQLRVDVDQPMEGISYMSPSPECTPVKGVPVTEQNEFDSGSDSAVSRPASIILQTTDQLSPNSNRLKPIFEIPTPTSQEAGDSREPPKSGSCRRKKSEGGDLAHVQPEKSIELAPFSPTTPAAQNQFGSSSRDDDEGNRSSLVDTLQASTTPTSSFLHHSLEAGSHNSESSSDHHVSRKEVDDVADCLTSGDGGEENCSELSLQLSEHANTPASTLIRTTFDHQVGSPQCLRRHGKDWHPLAAGEGDDQSHSGSVPDLKRGRDVQNAVGSIDDPESGPVPPTTGDPNNPEETEPDLWWPRDEYESSRIRCTSTASSEDELHSLTAAHKLAAEAFAAPTLTPRSTPKWGSVRSVNEESTVCSADERVSGSRGNLGPDDSLSQRSSSKESMLSSNIAMFTHRMNTRMSTGISTFRDQMTQLVGDVMQGVNELESQDGYQQQASATASRDIPFCPEEYQGQLRRGRGGGGSAGGRPVLVSITSCHRCTNEMCHQYLYDEAIMSEWTAEDSTFSIACPYCREKQLPKLTIRIKDYRHLISSQCLCCDGEAGCSKCRHDSLDTSSALSVHKSNPEIPTDPSNEVLDSTGSGSQLSLNQSGGGGASNDSHLGGGAGATGRGSSLEEHGRSIGGTASRHQHKASSSTVSSYGLVAAQPHEIGPIFVNYLSPLVIRKELDRLMDNCGDDLLTSGAMVDDKPEMYWNLVWYFSREHLQSHLPDLLLHSKLLNSESNPNKANEDSSSVGSSAKQRSNSKSSAMKSTSVQVKTYWDLLIEDETVLPLYGTWLKYHDRAETLETCTFTLNDIWTREKADVVIERGIKVNDLQIPLKDLLEHLGRPRKPCQVAQHPCRRSLYREMLYVALVALGARNISVEVYAAAYTYAHRLLILDQKLKSKFHKQDSPPTNEMITLCSTFGRLDL